VFYTNAFDVYGVSFYKPGDDHGAGGVGQAYLYYDGAGKLLGERLPHTWPAGAHPDLFHGGDGGDAECDRRHYLVAQAGVPRSDCGTPRRSMLKISMY